MLVLTRKKNESIVINEDVTVTVVQIIGDKVRLGIVAPKEIPVHRLEVHNAIHGKEPVKHDFRNKAEAVEEATGDRRLEAVLQATATASDSNS